MINYETIKRLAKENRISYKELIALAPQNDPFYVGTPADLEWAHWFNDLWQRFNYTDGVHLRRVHYRIISQDPPVLKPNGESYLNTENDWSYLCNAGKYARYLGLVSPTAFVDRRNPDAIINAYWKHPGDWNYHDPEPSWDIIGGWDDYDDTRYSLPELPRLNSLPEWLPDAPSFEADGYNVQQAVHLEVWAEKTTMNDVLQPLCSQYHVNLITGMGEMSITSVVDFMERIRKADRPARILYISDYDPSGLGMPISVARKVEFFWRKHNLEADVRLQPIVLTPEQAKEFNLPRTPVKESDKRKDTWEAIQGEGAVELDALEALHPGELRRIVRKTILNYYDTTLDRRAQDALSELEDLLETEHDDVMAYYKDEWDEIEQDYEALREDWRETQDRFNELVKPFEDDIESHREKLEDITQRVKDLFYNVKSDLENVNITTPEIPEANLPPEDNDVLYVSERDYLDQIIAYKLHRNGGPSA